MHSDVNLLFPMMLTSVGVVLFLLWEYKKEWGRVCLKVFFRRSFDKRKDMAVFCIGKMFDRNSLKFIVNRVYNNLYINK